MTLINIGFGNMVSAQRVIAMVSPESAPIKRMIQDARDRGLLIDASFGRSTRAALIMDSGNVILSALTPEVLAALDAAGVHGTFFVVATGYNEKYLPLLTQAAAAGHQIALHSASHEYSDIYRSSAAYWKDIALLKERIAPYVDAESIRYLRFPGGSTNTVSRRYGGKGLMPQLKAEVEQRGWQWVDWNVCAEDAVGGHPSADTIYRNVVRETGEQTHCVVLMHDSATTRTTAEALPDIIRWYTDNGYAFLTVAEALPLG